MPSRIYARKNLSFKHSVGRLIPDHVDNDIPAIREYLQQPLDRFQVQLEIPGEILVGGEAVPRIIAQCGDLRIEQLGIGREAGIIAYAGRQHRPVSGLVFFAHFPFPPCKHQGRCVILIQSSW